MDDVDKTMDESERWRLRSSEARAKGLFEWGALDGEVDGGMLACLNALEAL